jgi:DNA-binding protein HU-beta
LFEAELETTPRGVTPMNKAELVAAVSETSGLSSPQVRTALDSILDAVSAALAAGDEVRLVGFGSFSTAFRPAGHARNPRTGEAVRRPAARTVRFRAGEGLKRALN